MIFASPNLALKIEDNRLKIFSSLDFRFLLSEESKSLFISSV
jgi:hypothetical protein